MARSHEVGVVRAGRVPRLWAAFVLCWLPVFGVSAWGLVQNGLEPSELAAVALGLVVLTSLYLWLTLHGALSDADLALTGPGTAVVGRRVLTLAAMTAIVGALALLVPSAGVWWLIMHAIVGAGLALPLGLAAGVTAGLVALAFTGEWLVAGQLEILLLLQVAFGAGAMAIRRLTIAVAQLRAAREELAHLAVAEERLRFARDLHDLLGHSLSVIVLKSELAGRLLPAAPEQAMTEIADVERGAREALRQVRAAVTGYRLPTLEGELAAAHELLAAAGIEGTIKHTAGPLPTPLDGLLAWTVREGVTNVIRHSHARRCSIIVTCAASQARVAVTDDGEGTGGRSPPSGSGLSGLAERAAAHGGCLRAGPLPGGGFGLVVEAPVIDAAEGEAT